MLAMWLARKYTRSGLNEISRYFGRRSHSTVISAQKRVDRWLADVVVEVARDLEFEFSATDLGAAEERFEQGAAALARRCELILAGGLDAARRRDVCTESWTLARSRRPARTRPAPWRSGQRASAPAQAASSFS